MAISAALVKELRERTGAGMMECKKALVECDGEMDKAIEMMRTQGLAKAEKKAGRVAAEGKVVIQQSADGAQAAIVEVNCETDFVSGGDDFAQFADQVAAAVVNEMPGDLDALTALPVAGGETLDERRRALVAKIGENITIRRFALLAKKGDRFGCYSHGTRIGVVVDLKGGDDALARDLAMHVAASRPVCVSSEEVPQDLLDKERQIFAAQAQESGKPPEIVEKMVEGRVRKYLNEITLLGQPFVKDPDQTVEKLLKKAGGEVLGFVRYEVGEGIEKKVDNFAEEVMSQVRGG
ncbi:MAG: translation elongation factor Ts [Pseudomonadota bacterium]|nr:translation elongation factor Ts [Pseudomonadota bacterium]